MAADTPEAVPTKLEDFKPGRLVPREPKVAVSTLWADDGTVTVRFDDGTEVSGAPTDAIPAIPALPDRG